jgi:hypothetical protein
VYLVHRKAIQQAVAAQLAAWGDAPADEARKPKTRPIERDLEKVLGDLADDFPLLATLVERHRGGQTKLPMGREGKGPLPLAPPAPTPEGATPVEGGTPPEPAPAPEPPQADPPARPAAEPPMGRGGPKRPARYGLQIRFESRPDDLALGRLVESTVWVNEAHPAYRRAMATRSEGYHYALTTAMAVGPLAVEAARVAEFVTAFLARWGASGTGRRRGR